MAARTKEAITSELRAVVAPFQVSIEDPSNPGNVSNVNGSSSPIMAVITLLLVAIEVLMNIREGETAP